MFRRKHKVIIEVDYDNRAITEIIGKNLEQDECQAICATAAQLLAPKKPKRKRRNA